MSRVHDRGLTSVEPVTTEIIIGLDAMWGAH